MFEPVKVERKVLEKHVEQHLIRKMKSINGECYKWSSQNVRGVPDRICIFPNGEVWFVELKRDKGGKLTTRQKRFFERMVELHFYRAVVLKGKADVDTWFESIVGSINA